MKLQYFRGDRPNFGDELNSWLWPKLLPSFLDEDPATLFIGIGSILGNHYDPGAKKVVFGSGFVPSYQDAPDVRGDDWDIFFVRGPRTARALNIPERLGIGDGAILIRAVDVPRPPAPERVGFMPHWESLSRGNWESACGLAGIDFIDPTRPVDAVLDAMLGCRLLVTEAMHGAIVADALRIPWVPVLPLDAVHRLKWLDWAESLSIPLSSHRLWPSSVEEARIATIRRPRLSAMVGSLSAPGLARASDRALTHIAAKRLEALSSKPASLSRDGDIDSATNRMLEQLDRLRASYS
ncbi:polysaccharide pyruvyl transferase family protein [Tautonia sp. JC769]|uniref:polysaccharide pyruvyl transferase family protein n=1 Tax=Tautonia sp. JC769 TaxID=3232135 RepID=UPI003459BB83